MPTLIEQLQPQCITPDILNEIRIERYMQVCKLVKLQLLLITQRLCTELTITYGTDSFVLAFPLLTSTKPQVAAQMHAVALEPNALTVRYVSLKKFLGFMTKLYAHNGYASAAVRKHRYV